jgi:hypothetical protein
MGTTEDDAVGAVAVIVLFVDTGTEVAQSTTAHKSQVEMMVTLL